MSSEQSVDQGTIEKTKQQIRGLVHEIAQLSKSEVSEEQFYSEFLTRIVSALAAMGGAVWIRSEEGPLKLIFQIRLSETLLDHGSEDSARHLGLVHSVLSSGEASLVPPQSGAGEDSSVGNPTNSLIVLAPLSSDDRVEGVVEIFQRPNTQPATQRGYLRFLTQMCGMAEEWIKTRKLRSFSDRQSLWAQAEHFSRVVHESLDKRQTAYHIANEGRRLIGCDRVSVAIRKGRKQVVEAVSGQDLFDNRSNVVTMLGKLATVSVATEESLWYTGSTEDMPPQVENAIHNYVEESFSKTIAVLPLREAHGDPQDRPRHLDTDDASEIAHDTGEIIGALIVEQIESNVPREVLAPRVDLVYQHSARALSNSMQYNNLFLMPVWRALGKAAWVLRARTLPKTLAIAGIILVALLAMAVVPYQFNMEARGTLQPVVKKDVFVDVEGVVIDVPVEHGSQVKKGDLLVELHNTDLQVQLEDLLGQRESTRRQWQSTKYLLSNQARISKEERGRLSSQLSQLAERLTSLNRQVDLVRLKMDRLKVRSPIDGQVVTWNVEELLMRRPVQVGEVLMSLVEPDDEWELVLQMPDTRMGHLNRERKKLKEESNNPEAEPEVSYILATDPGEREYGTVKEVHQLAELNDEEGHSVQIKVDIKKEELNDPRPGATVIADVRCGYRPIGYVWFYQVWEWFQRSVLF